MLENKIHNVLKMVIRWIQYQRPSIYYKNFSKINVKLLYIVCNKVQINIPSLIFTFSTLLSDHLANNTLLQPKNYQLGVIFTLIKAPCKLTNENRCSEYLESSIFRNHFNCYSTNKNIGVFNYNFDELYFIRLNHICLCIF